MNDYFQELRKAQGHFHKRFYPTSIRECGRIVEIGLKELYENLETHLKENERSSDLERMMSDFELAYTPVTHSFIYHQISC